MTSRLHPSGTGVLAAARAELPQPVPGGQQARDASSVPEQREAAGGEDLFFNESRAVRTREDRIGKEGVFWTFKHVRPIS